MNEKLEQLPFEMFPEIWEHIDSNILGYERDVNYEQRQKWLEDAKKIYNLALADVREEVERRKAVNEHFNLDEKVNEDVHILYLIHNLTK